MSLLSTYTFALWLSRHTDLPQGDEFIEEFILDPVWHYLTEEDRAAVAEWIKEQDWL